MKKLMKKLIAMATALVMIVTLLPAVGVKAGSVPTGSITIEKTTQDATNPLEGAGFSVYCMLTFFERNTNNDGRNNMQWTVDQVGLASQFSEITVTQGMNVNDLDMSQFTTEIAKTVEGNPTQYQKYQLGHEQLTQIQDGSNKATTTFNVPYGIYLVVETTVPDSDGVHTYTQCEPFFVSIPMTETEEDENGDVVSSTWIDDIVVTPKNTESGGDKTIVGTTAEEKNADAAIGDEVQYEITATVPANGTEFAVVDKIHGLDYITDEKAYPLTVTIGDTTLVKDIDYTIDTTTTKGQMTITFTNTFLQNKAYFGKTVSIKYYARVTEEAYIGTGNINSAEIDYGNDSNVIINNKPGVYTYGLQLEKCDADDSSTKLEGVQFELRKKYVGESINPDIKEGDPVTGAEFGDNGKDTNDGIYVTGENGLLNIKGLAAGTYFLKEIQTQDGYTLLANPIEIEILNNGEKEIVGDETLTASVANPIVKINGVVTTDKYQKDSNNIYFKFEVSNQKGFSLPSTGGMGTYLFTIGGIVIMAGAAFALIAMKKRA